MTNEDGELAMFEGHAQAKQAADGNPLAEAFGAIVFDADIEGDDI